MKIQNDFLFGIEMTTVEFADHVAVMPDTWAAVRDASTRLRVLSLRLDYSTGYGAEAEFIWYLTGAYGSFETNEQGLVTVLRRENGIVLWELGEPLPAGDESWLNVLVIDGHIFWGPVTRQRLGQHVSGW